MTGEGLPVDDGFVVGVGFLVGVGFWEGEGVVVREGVVERVILAASCLTSKFSVWLSSKSVASNMVLSSGFVD